MALDLASAALKLVVIDDKEAGSSQSSDRLLMKRRPPLSLFIPPRARSSLVSARPSTSDRQTVARPYWLS
jgi:hypothetical protein